MKKLLQTSDHLLIGGHRGCECELPENSIAAMERGIHDGADYLEIDVQLTRDGVPVIYHDVRLEDKTSLTGYVHEFTESELREVVPGFCTLREAMRWGKQANAWFGLELKGVPLDTQPYNLRLVELISSVLREEGMTDHVFVFGLDYQVLRHLREVDPDVPIGLIIADVPQDPVALMKEMDACIYLAYIWQMTPQIIHDLHAAGYYVDGAILRDKKWQARARELGVDMFETDYPVDDAKTVTKRIPH
ncbi:MAG: glycerophosphodiester phosphodiesterase [Oscillospiraceae bacterium]|nr:glycerophosphodiester phosphodiesterase [Oscillospiraceae bacterium]